jgi:hypothetical protein
MLAKRRRDAPVRGAKVLDAATALMPAYADLPATRQRFAAPICHRRDRQPCSMNNSVHAGGGAAASPRPSACGGANAQAHVGRASPPHAAANHSKNARSDRACLSISLSHQQRKQHIDQKKPTTGPSRKAAAGHGAEQAGAVRDSGRRRPGNPIRSRETQTFEE